MRYTGWWKQQQCAYILSLILLVLAGCEGSNGTGENTAISGTGRVHVQVATAAQDRAGVTSQALLEAQTRQGGTLTRVRIEISGLGIPTPLVVECALQGPSTDNCMVTETPTAFIVEVEVEVPIGFERVVVVTAFDRTATAILRGQATINLTQSTQTVPVTLVPVNTPVNTPPIANAGADQTVAAGTTVSLNGASSSDADGNPLTFAWTVLVRPTSSQATLSDPVSVMPTLVADRPGTYMVQLVVKDGREESAPDVVTLHTANSAPVAQAGATQSVGTMTTVTLRGEASSDVDGDPLTFMWSLLSVPPGSQVMLSSPTAMNPTFVVDRVGTYVAQLTVSDGELTSVPATVIVSTINVAPVADAGPPQTVFVHTTVHLDGSRSGDADGDLLSFAWSLATQPPGSTAVLSGANTVAPTFMVDVPGAYVAQLIVSDGELTSAPVTVMITTGNSVPVANAGPAQNVSLGAMVQLDGSASHDADGTPLTFAWSLTVRPPASAAVLSNPHAVNPKFVVDVPGAYVAQLIVSDGQFNSAPVTVTISHP